ncbi:sensor domain-containing diguanylate cyclase [Enterobacillus tribolii]|uniref:diguanylate cyclase n=1 Tax=Enterobacillus tribolii TaxID=1487935 RepID=A0A370QRK8_9GAMM|nr:sensor domain-containing diguanylate cyclase [Enterobacillus tribolii]RDK91898.1 diguanylate cyclase (GGDEF)-like protein [Enterobacillus tribolii]
MKNTVYNFNQYLFLLFLFVVLIPLTVFFHYVDTYIGYSTKIIAPMMVAVLLVCHALIAFFMLLRYLHRRKRFYLAALSAAYGVSACYLLYQLLSYPGVFSAQAIIPGELNDIGINLFFRSMLVALIFLVAMILYRKKYVVEKHSPVMVVMLMAVGILMTVLAWLYSSHYPPLSLTLISGDGRYDGLWRNGSGYILGGVWLITSLLVLYYSHVKNAFWLAISLTCVAHVGSLAMLHGSNTSVNSLACYFARVFEMASAFLVMLVLLYDIFHVHQNTLKKYLDSYESAMRDPLTLLYNRRYFLDALKGRLEHFSQHGAPFAVIVADIDMFKRFNDLYGHIKGDEVIRYVAYTMMHSLGEADVSARLGGEEFCAIIEARDMQEAYAIADRLRLNVGNDKASGFDGTLPESVAISIGVYLVEGAGETMEQCLEKADIAMYAAKRTGRNRVVVYDDVLMRKEEKNQAPSPA